MSDLHETIDQIQSELTIDEQGKGYACSDRHSLNPNARSPK
jgi:hypothetical protein